MAFAAPTADQLLALRVCAGVEELAASERFATADMDVVAALVAGIADFAAGEIAPLDRVGDRQGAQFADGVVRLPSGFREAYQAFVAQGWNGIGGPPEFGGQGLPFSLSTCVLETVGTASFAFGLLPMLTAGAIEALSRHGSAGQKARFLPPLVSGRWSGTMNLTEPQAGSDVGALRTTATPIEAGPNAGCFLIRGVKIFITFGEHDAAENIVHLVLARTPGAPAGSRGVSMFIVPKVLVDDDGRLGERNDLRCLGIEHKLGIHASPTCTMSYGENDACIGELIGGENAGLQAMFTMMNAARISVGSQGVQIAEAAWQQARRYAGERVQSARVGGSDRQPVAIVEHPDVRRMLLRMRALTEGARALLYYTAGQVDRGAQGSQAAQSRAELLVPLIKAWATDIGVEVASLGLQVHGGAGYVEETGAAQHFRDARIAPIYEGTNGIQAADFVTRKLALGSGAVHAELMTEIAEDAAGSSELSTLAGECRETAAWFRQACPDDRLAGSVPFLTMNAVAVAGWQLLRQARAVDQEQPAKVVTARYFNERIVPEARGLRAHAIGGAGLLYALDAATLVG